MKPRKPGTKTGNGAARGSGLDEHHGNLKNPLKCFCHTSDILMKGREFFPQTQVYLNFHSTRLHFCVLLDGRFVSVSTTDFSHIQAGPKLISELCWECRSLFRGREEKSDGFRSPPPPPPSAKIPSINFNTASEDFINRGGNWTFFNISRR